jgi:hypothetical protein
MRKRLMMSGLGLLFAFTLNSSVAFAKPSVASVTPVQTNAAGCVIIITSDGDVIIIC